MLKGLRFSVHYFKFNQPIRSVGSSVLGFTARASPCRYSQGKAREADLANRTD